ncbi:MAG: small multi-drug export protein [Tissierellaceae bacterium]|nr:small multi-drug export protein [Tissierellaceae bacterium]
MTDFLTELFKFISEEFTVIFTAMLPLIEVRGAIPVGIALGMSPLHATILAFLGSVIPVPFILFTIRPIFAYLRKTRTFRKLVNNIAKKSMEKSLDIQKYGYIGLFLFVAIPLPGTGVWSGSLIASLLNMRIKYAFPTILLGNLVASTVIMVLSFGVVNIFG